MTLVAFSLHLGNSAFILVWQKWCSAPLSCLPRLRTWVVMGPARDPYIMDIWDQGAACPLFTAWFCRRTSFIPHGLNKRGASRSDRRRQLRAWLGMCLWMPELAPNGTVGVYGTGWEGGRVGQLHLRHLKYPKVHIDKETKVCVMVTLQNVVADNWCFSFRQKRCGN